MPLRARGREEGGGSATRVSTSLIRVRYAETDQMGVAYHGGYFAWFEVGRTDLLRSRGMTYKNLEAADLRLPVIETGARYLRPVFYDDVIEGQHDLVLAQSELLRSGTEGPVATAFTAHAAVDARGRPRRLPRELRSLLE